MVVACLTAAVLAASCSETEKRELAEYLGLQKDPAAEDVAEAATLKALRDRSESLAVRDTIASVGYLIGRRIMRVRGYGIVVGLGNKGSSEVPGPIREELIGEIRKRNHSAREQFGMDTIDPEALLDSRDTAVVLVAGEIKPATLEGGTFDVWVQAVPGTQTESLAGGHLWRCDLKMYRETSAGRVTEGRALAHAEGPVYIAPFTQIEDAATPVDPRRGQVLAGGTATQDREIHIEMYNPSYQTSTQVAETINARFSTTPPVADAVSPGRVKMRVPDAYVDDADHFLDLVLHLYLPKEPDFPDRRARALVAEIQRTNALHEDIALAWEALGRNVLSHIRDLYADPRPDVAYHAARTGLRLNDELAIETLRRFAYEPDTKYQSFAIAELGKAGGLHQAAAAIRPLLNQSDPRVRGWAYEALLERGDRAIETIPAAGGDFFLDIVNTDGPPLIRANVTAAPRLAVFGNGVQCRAPLFYASSDRSLTISAGAEDVGLTVVRQWPNREGMLSFVCSPEVGPLVLRLADWPAPSDPAEPPGAGVGYSQVVETLFALCEQKAINAQFVLEKPRLSDLLRPLRPSGRPMTDLD